MSLKFNIAILIITYNMLIINFNQAHITLITLILRFSCVLKIRNWQIGNPSPRKANVCISG